MNDKAILLCVRENLEKSADLTEAKARIDILLLLTEALINPELGDIFPKYFELIKKCSGAVTF